MGVVLLFPIACRSCGKPVEEARRCYAIPTCYRCLPPPPPLPICDPRNPESGIMKGSIVKIRYTEEYARVQVVYRAAGIKYAVVFVFMPIINNKVTCGMTTRLIRLTYLQRVRTRLPSDVRMWRDQMRKVPARSIPGFLNSWLLAEKVLKKVNAGEIEPPWVLPI